MPRTVVVSDRACSHCSAAPGTNHGRKCLIGHLEGMPGFRLRACKPHGERRCVVCYCSQDTRPLYAACLKAYPRGAHGTSVSLCRDAVRYQS